jgi:putative FmdB family regulatory protein
MPLYEYKCKQCKKHTEHIQKFSDPEITKCPLCGGPLERVISAAAISFKGGGWFKDGYSHTKPKSSKEKESKSDSGKSSTEASASSGKDVKPAAASSAPTSPAASASSSSDKK